MVLEGLYDKPVSVEFTGPHQSSDGGVLLLDAMDQKLGLIDRMAKVLCDGRQSGKVTYSMESLLRERIFGIACGYPKCDDADRLAQDPALTRSIHEHWENGYTLSYSAPVSRTLRARTGFFRGRLFGTAIACRRFGAAPVVCR
jgi:hypothetical protein